jgi:endonuclease-3 related protein
MSLIDLYQHLSLLNERIEPHHDTWMLWLKKKNEKEIFEVAIGTVLVQNTNWKNVNIAIDKLFSKKIKSFEQLLKLKQEQLEQIIRPAGFYKQKASYLRSLAELFQSLNIKGEKRVTRKQLLSVKGIGKETADSILVYCFYKPIPIIGVYTRRFLARMFADELYLKEKYENIQEEIRLAFPSDYYTLGKFHALIVSHCQNFCQKQAPKCSDCSLKSQCLYGLHFQDDPKVAQIQEFISSPK